MNIIQRDIDSAYHDFMHLRENIIRTCQDYSAFIVDLNNLIFDTSELINNFYVLIVNYEIVYKFV